MQERLAFVYFLTFIYLLQDAVTKCPDGWYSWRSSCYSPLEGSHDWLAASEICRNQGGLLMVPNSIEEHEFIMSLRDMLFREHEVRHLWIGCEISEQKLKCLGEANAAEIFGKWAEKHSPDDISGRMCIRKGGLNLGWLFFADCDKRLFTICETQIFSVYCLLSGADGRVTPQCLLGHEIKNLTVKGVSECGQACWAEPRCRSFNVWQGGPPKICQLNNVTREEVSDHGVIELGNCFYFNL